MTSSPYCNYPYHALILSNVPVTFDPDHHSYLSDFFFLKFTFSLLKLSRSVVLSLWYTLHLLKEFKASLFLFLSSLNLHRALTLAIFKNPGSVVYQTLETSNLTNDSLQWTLVSKDIWIKQSFLNLDHLSDILTWSYFQNIYFIIVLYFSSVWPSLLLLKQDLILDFALIYILCPRL